jgi:phosphotransferase system HPr (HPr) family protein
MSKVVIEVTVLNQEGLHARPAMRFVDAANGFGSDIVVRSESDTVDGKSVMGMMTLGATQGTRLTIEACGDDAPAAVESLKRLFDEKFGED